MSKRLRNFSKKYNKWLTNPSSDRINLTNVTSTKSKSCKTPCRVYLKNCNKKCREFSNWTKRWLCCNNKIKTLWLNWQMREPKLQSKTKFIPLTSTILEINWGKLRKFMIPTSKISRKKWVPWARNWLFSGIIGKTGADCQDQGSGLTISHPKG